MVVLAKNALEILQDRYFIKNDKGVIVETASQLFTRVARHISTAEKKDQDYWQKQFYNVMSNLDFLPNSPTLMNAGLPKGQLSACFVLPVYDSLNEIFTTLKSTALIHQSGGGTGFNFSRLRPKNDKVSSSGGTSSGPLAFMKIFDAATEYVKQGGKRRGANMGVLNIDHPDIESFIKSKSDNDELQNFNISVGISDRFMKAVIDDADWSLINPRTKRIEKKVKATYLWDLIVANAWNSGDPGLLFLDTINLSNPTPKLGKIQSTNPCGEVPLLDYESCNLGSINLSHMLKNRENGAEINWRKLAKTIDISVRFLDNVIDVNHYLLSETERVSKENRKIGLGLMGWAEMLIKLNIRYGSAKAVNLAKKMMKFIQNKSYEASRKLIKEKGNYSRFNETNDSLIRRNATCNSIAPTGTISVIANTTYSIEPLFAVAYKRTGILSGKTQLEINRLFVDRMKNMKLWNKKLKDKILETGSVQNINVIPNEIKAIFKNSIEIPWKYHLLHQKAFQKYTDNAVSKTINLPEKTSIKEISDIYKTAWIYKLKGITIYRNGSRNKQIIQRCNYNNSNNC